MSKDIYNLLSENNEEFIPHLTERGTIEEYYNTTMSRNLLMLYRRGRLAGLLSYYITSSIDNGKENTIRIATVLVDKDFRNQGIATGLYNSLFNKTQELDLNYEVKTWSTNKIHKNILENLGFELIYTIENDRAKGIHTLFYRKDIKE